MSLATATTPPRAVIARLWNAFPVTEPAFAKLLGLLDVELTTAVPSAAVSLGLHSRLRLNPEFLERHCQRDEALVMLVLHELWHVVLGHTRLCARRTPADNWAFDAVINAQLCRLYPDPAHTRLFRDCYAPDRMPAALLRPPPGWRTPAEQWLPGPAGEVHRLLYSDASASVSELFQLLPRVLVGVAVPPEALLGSHAANAAEEAALAAAELAAGGSPELRRELREILAEWPMVEPRSGRDQGGDLRLRQLARQRARAAAVQCLRGSLLRLAGLAEGTGQRHPGVGALETVLPYGRDRAAVLRGLWGDAVPLHRAAAVGPARPPRERVRVYLDVSGSMAGTVAPLYAAIAALAPWVAPRIHLFSTRVADLSLTELRHGKLRTTEGTDIRCVSAHLLEQRVARALIVTDGWVGTVPGEHAAALRRRGTRVEAAVTADGDPAFLRPLGGRCCVLPALAD